MKGEFYMEKKDIVTMVKQALEKKKPEVKLSRKKISHQITLYVEKHLEGHYDKIYTAAKNPVKKNQMLNVLVQNIKG